MQCKPPSFCRREREGGWEREKGVTRIQFITSEAAGTQPTMHTGRDVQNAQQFAQRTICTMVTVSGRDIGVIAQKHLCNAHS